MRFLLDAFYLLALLVLSPWLVWKALTTGKYRRGLRSKLLGLSALPPPHGGPIAWFHGVSVGEVHLLRQVVAAFRRRYPDWRCVLSTTTDTGFEEARRCFPDLSVFFFPFDFSWAVRRALRAVSPALVVLAEGELWPNFLLAAKAFGVPVAVVNGRMSPRSFRRYRRLGPLAGWLLGHLDLMVMQNEEYAACVRGLGVPPYRIKVTGSVKFDGATMDRHNPATEELRRRLHVADGDLVWVAGSTQAPEEDLALGIYRRALVAHPNLRLFLVPRQRERFDEVAHLLQRSGVPFARRSAESTERAPVVLVDTIGELGALWGLADVAFVGGSLDGRRGGQNMIEPAAYGSAVVFGPHVWNFRDTATRLVEAGAAWQVSDGADLEDAVRKLLADAGQRERLGRAARAFVLAQQGATEQTVTLLGEMTAERPRWAAAA
jgi:3-deoxy-D-manno-octulosonic-acid transferase